ncbi:site-specific DNA-methyltransferase [Paramaledivibacter caminithermalis]|jgi:adenine-specific DNA-methyltransferase|uniref:Adenine-specific DNA-methyltransferase n=1 Tax=Paramaledivibacter caminithermalis (strain DSM 15212 / CIP 107654 / DViRD3) TaxID=1121301 RepID=A0A1M6M8P0_PARC5|nr:site-specific DNA-methyltransferase [Paramaledivibacter caminithermalis]SHJ79784.1 adenine-specific DNA-methyltransferase [Paramaledivibacter caminithermalis DSM 15212]
MSDKLNKFKELLRTMFEMDKADLDFGIYRIMNQKRDEINKFLDEDLLPQVKDELSKLGSKDVEDKKKELEKLKITLEDAGVIAEETPKYQTLKNEIESSIDIASLENEIFSSLTNFFSRYYKEGDFISKRRYKEGVYAIPYEGEEVKLHWANADQYYVKSSENFRDYTFKLDDSKIVHFKVVEASTEKDNNKTQDGERRFVLNEEKFIDIINGELVIYFNFVIRPKGEKREKINEQTMKKLLESITANSPYKEFIGLFVNRPTEKNKKRTLLEKHLNDYTAKNTFDYFIHKDLGGFLRRELDFYIKNEVMFIDDIEEDEQKVIKSISKVKVIKKIGNKIIKFLEQLENFEKKLWEKKKFVIETNYCITLDKIDEKLYPEIINNKEQIKEWKELFAIDELDGYSEELNIDFLKNNPYLVLDTKFFNIDFKEKLLCSFENLDKEIDGLLVHSDNFHALNLLKEKYEQQVKCVYIDPPYNTNASKIAYKNGYEHSSWISLMESRLNLAKEFMAQNGIIQVAIDDYEFRYLNLLMESVFGRNNMISNIGILTNPKGRDQEFIAQAHDYTIMYGKDKRYSETYNFELSEEDMKAKYSKGEGKESYRELPLKRTGSGKWREDRPYMFFPFLYDEKKDVTSIIPKEEYDKIYDKYTDSFDDVFLMELKNKYEMKGFIFILPMDSNGSYLRWRWGYESCRKGIEKGSLFTKKTISGKYNIYEKNMGDAYYTPKSLWIGEKYDASSKGTNLLNSIIPNNPFDYPKSLYTVEDNLIIGSNDDSLVLDFFAGSGTTGHAVINLNREGKGKRKYILVEMGEYFNTVTKPRIQKVVYSKDWKNGKPVSREGSSHIFKYIKLESYEDTLNNLLVRNDIDRLLLESNKDFKEDYMLSYMLDVETKGSNSLLNVDKFNNPFRYTLNIERNLETKKVNVDLVETFNYLIGLKVNRIEKTQKFNAISSNKGEGTNSVKLEQSKEGDYLFKEVEGYLPSGEKALIIWRTLTGDSVKDNAALDAYFLKKRYSTLDMEFDYIYVNGDNNLPNLKVNEDKWKVILIEDEFHKRMFEEKGL